MRAQWQFKLVTACAQHNVALRDRCSLCGAVQRLTSSTTLTCACGTSLRSAPDEPAADELALVVSTAASDLVEGRPCVGLSFELLQKLVLWLGQFSTDTAPYRPGQVRGLDELAVAMELVAGASALIRQWPHNFVAMLDALARRHERCPSLRRTFAPLYRVLYDELYDDEFQFLRDAFERFLQERWWGLVCKRNRRLKADTIARHERVGMSRAARASGVSRNALRRLVQAGTVVAEVCELPSGRRLISLSRAQIREVTAMAKGAMSLEEVAATLALPQARVRELIDAGLLPVLARRERSSDGPWMISRKDLPSIKCEEVESPCRSLRFILRYWHLTLHERLGLVRAILEGRLSGRTSEQPAALGEVLLNAEAARSWVRDWRAPTGNLAVGEVAASLGVKEEVAYQLVSRGLMAATGSVRFGGSRIAVDELTRFREAYVSLSALAKQRKTSPRALLQRLPVRPVTGPTVDGGRQYFFRRSEVAAWSKLG